MLLITEWTPDSLEVKHIEVSITLHLLEKVDRELTLSMRKGTQFPILTLIQVVRVARAVFRFVLFRMIKIFDSIVTEVAVVAFGTVLAARRYERAQL